MNAGSGMSSRALRLGMLRRHKAGFRPTRRRTRVRPPSSRSGAWVLQPVPVPTGVTALQTTEPAEHSATGGYLYSVTYAGPPCQTAASPAPATFPKIQSSAFQSHSGDTCIEQENDRSRWQRFALFQL